MAGGKDSNPLRTLLAQGLRFCVVSIVVFIVCVVYAVWRVAQLGGALALLAMLVCTFLLCWLVGKFID
jgi:hypothetical protein